MMPLPLTEIFDEVSERGMRETPNGMAHWKGSGPKGKTCRECMHYDLANRPKRYRSDGKDHGKGELMPAGCREWKRLMKHEKCWPKLRHSLAACKYFDEKANPPAAFDVRAI